MKKNLVLTAAFGFGIQQLELFVKTLRKYYTDDICFIIGFNDRVIEQELKKYNCIIIKKNIDKRDVQSKRYDFFLEFLKDKNYENIFCCDSRDIYFQSNPFDFNYEGSINFFLEDKEINNCPYNSNWIIKTYGLSAFKDVSDKEKSYYLIKEFKFENFIESQNFVNKVGNIAEEEAHHPDISFGWGYCKVKIFTHAIKGLAESDFILAAKIDRI